MRMTQAWICTGCHPQGIDDHEGDEFDDFAAELLGRNVDLVGEFAEKLVMGAAQLPRGGGRC